MAERRVRRAVLAPRLACPELPRELGRELLPELPPEKRESDKRNFVPRDWLYSKVPIRFLSQPTVKLSLEKNGREKFFRGLKSL